MDRRPVIGFVLIFLLIIGYPLLMNKLSPPRPQPVKPVATATAPATTTTPADTPQASPAAAATGIGQLADPLLPPAPLTTAQMLEPAPSTSAPAIVTVTTPLYRARIDTRGGAVVGWELLKHKSWRGGPVQVVPQEVPFAGADQVTFREAKLDLATFPFTADRTEVSLAAGGQKQQVVLRGLTRGGLEVAKVFTFDPATYGVHVDIRLGGEATAAGAMLLQTGPADAITFGWNKGIAQIERLEKQERPNLLSFAALGEDTHTYKREALRKNVEKVTGQWRGSVRFAGLQDRYFTVIGIVPRGQGGPVEATVRLGGDQAHLVQTWAIELPARRDNGAAIGEAGLDLYIGPQQAELLVAYSQGLEKTIGLNVPSWMRWARPLTTLVLWGMELMHKVVPNYGVIIIIFAVLTKLMFYPLTKKSTESMRKMQELQPKMKALQEKYKNDKEKLNQATLKLYQEEKINPLSGCLPLLVQSPVFIALYQAFSVSVSLRGQPFFGWIHDLSQPDALFALPFALPFLGADFNVLPLLMGIAMYVQTKFTPNTGGGQMAAMNAMMPVLMIVFFYNVPSGLTLYWLINNVMQAYQSWQIHRTTPKVGGVATA